MFENMRIEKYLKKLRHPEVEYYGLYCDSQLWADFNKELRLREILFKHRETLNQMMMLLGKPENCNHAETYNDAERLYALAKLSLMVQQGKINKLTYEIIKERK